MHRLRSFTMLTLGVSILVLVAHFLSTGVSPDWDRYGDGVYTRIDEPEMFWSIICAMAVIALSCLALSWYEYRQWRLSLTQKDINDGARFLKFWK